MVVVVYYYLHSQCIVLSYSLYNLYMLMVLCYSLYNLYMLMVLFHSWNNIFCIVLSTSTSIAHR